MQGRPEVSVVIPAYRAGATLRRAVRSVLASGLPANQIEIAIASDDGQDYSAMVPPEIALAQAEPGPIASGVGPARNRAVDVATGRFLAFLDADDTWEPGYLADALPIARREGLCFSPTQIVQDGVPLFRTFESPRITLQELSRTGASHHPVALRELVGEFRNGPAQDVLHAVELITLNGGSAAASRRAYELHLLDGSVSRQPGFARLVARSYHDIIREIVEGRTRVPPDWRAAAAKVFHDKLSLNQAYEESQASGFYEFMAERSESADRVTRRPAPRPPVRYS